MPTGKRGKHVNSRGGGQTNPLKKDPELKSLLKKLDKVSDKKAFEKWRDSFLSRFVEFLDEKGTASAEQQYWDFSDILSKLISIINKLSDLIEAGTISPDKSIPVKARQCLQEFNRTITNTIEEVDKLLPGTMAEERAVGYTKFHMGAVLVRDGFREYGRLSMAADVLERMEGQLAEVADRQILLEMKRYGDKLKSFCDIMADLGLFGAMLKCREFVQADDDEERIRVSGDFLQEDNNVSSFEKRVVEKYPSFNHGAAKEAVARRPPPVESEPEEEDYENYPVVPVYGGNGSYDDSPPTSPAVKQRESAPYAFSPKINAREPAPYGMTNCDSPPSSPVEQRESAPYAFSPKKPAREPAPYGMTNCESKPSSSVNQRESAPYSFSPKNPAREPAPYASSSSPSPGKPTAARAERKPAPYTSVPPKKSKPTSSMAKMPRPTFGLRKHPDCQKAVFVAESSESEPEPVSESETEYSTNETPIIRERTPAPYSSSPPKKPAAFPKQKPPSSPAKKSTERKPAPYGSSSPKTPAAAPKQKPASSPIKQATSKPKASEQQQQQKARQQNAKNRKVDEKPVVRKREPAPYSSSSASHKATPEMSRRGSVRWDPNRYYQEEPPKASKAPEKDKNPDHDKPKRNILKDLFKSKSKDKDGSGDPGEKPVVREREPAPYGSISPAEPDAPQERKPSQYDSASTNKATAEPKHENDRTRKSNNKGESPVKPKRNMLNSLFKSKPKESESNYLEERQVVREREPAPYGSSSSQTEPEAAREQMQPSSPKETKAEPKHANESTGKNDSVQQNDTSDSSDEPVVQKRKRRNFMKDFYEKAKFRIKKRMRKKKKPPKPKNETKEASESEQSDSESSYETDSNQEPSESETLGSDVEEDLQVACKVGVEPVPDEEMSKEVQSTSKKEPDPRSKAAKVEPAKPPPGPPKKQFGFAPHPAAANPYKEDECQPEDISEVSESETEASAKEAVQISEVRKVETKPENKAEQSSRTAPPQRSAAAAIPETNRDTSQATVRPVSSKRKNVKPDEKPVSMKGASKEVKPVAGVPKPADQTPAFVDDVPESQKATSNESNGMKEILDAFGDEPPSEPLSRSGRWVWQEDPPEEAPSPANPEMASGSADKSHPAAPAAPDCQLKKEPITPRTVNKPAASSQSTNVPEKEKAPSVPTSPKKAVSLEKPAATDPSGDEPSKNNSSSSSSSPTAKKRGAAAVAPKKKEVDIELRKKCYMWYARLGQPNRATMKKKVANLPGACDITPDDVDELPWICNGMMCSVSEMNKLFMGNIPVPVEKK